MFTRYNKDTIKLTDLIFFWNKYHYNLVKKISDNSDLNKFHITGSPIMDTWHYLSKKKKKKYILICTSFTLVNNLADKKILNLFYDNIDKKFLNSYKKYLKNYLKYYEIGFDNYLRILPKIISNNKKIKFVIRPHPAENPLTWENFAKNYKNVAIDNKTNLIDQINNSYKVIHFNSTAGIQSLVQGKDTYMYFPKKEKFLDLSSPIFKKINQITYNKNDFIKLKKNKIRQINEFNLNNKITFYSSKKIFEIINSSLKVEKNQKDPFQNLIISYFYFFRYKFYNYLYKLILRLKFFFSFKKKDETLIFARSKKYFSHKWDKTTKDEIRKLINLFDKNKSLSKNLIIDQHQAGFFRIKKR